MHAVHGRVVQCDDGRPIAGATVVVEEEAEGFQETRRATTEADGQFGSQWTASRQYRVGAAGPPTLIVEKTGFETDRRVLSEDEHAVDVCLRPR